MTDIFKRLRQIKKNLFFKAAFNVPNVVEAARYSHIPAEYSLVWIFYPHHFLQCPGEICTYSELKLIK
jgi:hypothetical protein